MHRGFQCPGRLTSRVGRVNAWSNINGDESVDLAHVEVEVLNLGSRSRFRICHNDGRIGGSIASATGADDRGESRESTPTAVEEGSVWGRRLEVTGIVLLLIACLDEIDSIGVSVGGRSGRQDRCWHAVGATSATSKTRPEFLPMMQMQQRRWRRRRRR